MITCIGCGCDDDHACRIGLGRCIWLRRDPDTGSGVCSNCPEFLRAWDVGDREASVVEEDVEDLCPGCGKVIDVTIEGYDDLRSAPYVTVCGDVYCIPCGQRIDTTSAKLLERETWL